MTGTSLSTVTYTPGSLPVWPDPNNQEPGDTSAWEKYLQEKDWSDVKNIPETQKIPIHVLGHNYQIEMMFMERGNFKLSGLFEARVIVFGGGEDVTPTFYGDTKHPETKNNTARDDHEARVFSTLRDRQLSGKQDVIFVGICRGGQFLNVMNGGRLYQDVDNHLVSHVLEYTRLKGHTEHILVTSTHHQMMIPAASGRVWGTCLRSTYRDKGEDTRKPRPENDKDTEIVFYPLTRTLCFQPHPEYVSAAADTTRDLFFKCFFRGLLFDQYNAANAEDPNGAPYGETRKVMM